MEGPLRRDVEPPPAQGAYSDQPDYEQPDPNDDEHAPPPMAGTRLSPVDQQAQIDEIQARLREFREAVRDLTESRRRRRYF
ncbi:hypothetical protein [Mesorhizobium sp. ORS 3428]|uniref:hypothetical protein n=1 Tax=Mesorhizobium sp. ORS 3428 TaxID=540997 RepID=UPI0008DA1DAA|nr:hypothetical protein [Mesorhizobium sp. ORS 3428]OHV88615.1 hypothetical protein ORS3428_18945 [Mesorhizobium sp. ORS 3428]